MRTLRMTSVIFAAMLALAVTGCDDGDDPGGTTGPLCGDGACNGDEDFESCDTDCPAVCGDGVCDWLGDEPGMCDDCVYCGDGVCMDGEEGCEYDCAVCGDGVCGDGEVGVCVPDCHQCSSELTWYYLVDCNDPDHCPPEWPCAVCGDGDCNWMEMGWCPDCDGDPTCGDDECTAWEIGTCAADCDSCGDGTCGADEMNCARDCSECGDGVCDVTEGFSEADYCNIDCRS